MFGKTFPAANQALEDMLKMHANKAVIAFYPKDQVHQEEFFSHEDFWRILSRQGFSDYFIQQPPAIRNDIAEFVGHWNQHQGLPLHRIRPEAVHSPALNFLRYFVHTVWNAQKNGITTSFVDLNSPPPTDAVVALNELNSAMVEAYTQYSLSGRISLALDDSIEAKLDNAVDFLRGFIQTPDGQTLRQSIENASRYKDSLLQSLNDPSTGQFVSSLMEQTKGRVFLGFKTADFNPCGIQTYIEDPLVIVVYANKTAYEIETALARHPDIAPITSPDRPYWIKHSVLLLEEGMLIEQPVIPASAEAIRQERDKWQTTFHKAGKPLKIFPLPQDVQISGRRQSNASTKAWDVLRQPLNVEARRPELKRGFFSRWFSR